NPGTMYQRIKYAITQNKLEEATIVSSGDGFIDLLLPGGASTVTLERAVSRRSEIDAVYRDLVKSDVVIITLGLIEAWYDNETGLFLNQMPPVPVINRSANRFSFHVLDVSESYP